MQSIIILTNSAHLGRYSCKRGNHSDAFLPQYYQNTRCKGFFIKSGRCNNWMRYQRICGQFTSPLREITTRITMPSNRSGRIPPAHNRHQNAVIFCGYIATWISCGWDSSLRMIFFLKSGCKRPHILIIQFYHLHVLLNVVNCHGDFSLVTE